MCKFENNKAFFLVFCKIFGNSEFVFSNIFFSLIKNKWKEKK